MPARGPIAHPQTVLDNALLLQAIAGADGIDDRQQAGCPFPSDVPDYPSLAKQGVKGLKIGILSEGLDRPLADKRVSELVVKAAEALRELGAEVEEVSVPFHKEAPDVWAVSGFPLDSQPRNRSPRTRRGSGAHRARWTARCPASVAGLC